ncbi:VWA domain-containing protein [Sulfoacidibacillus thermotolerans]|uniref:VWFA domain-containing protein n=1 Tax=Sulfoacidibacillus thermotolerans TaxID=1765684 RepID=A0A2U3DB13_SULT2|nr:VWA domain-containing protein [Sulfoacidibacillus thermotolerans]PWI58468.1 hypothetical protein BM613_02795 [Sulfoacidibacillus thermotolerans]
MVSRRAGRPLKIRKIFDDWKRHRVYKRSLNRQIDAWIAAQVLRAQDGQETSVKLQANGMEAPAYLASEAAERQKSGVFYKSHEAGENWGGEYVSDIDAPASSEGKAANMKSEESVRKSPASSLDAEQAFVSESLETAEMLHIEKWFEEMGRDFERQVLKRDQIIQNTGSTPITKEFDALNQSTLSMPIMEQGLDQLSETAIENIRQLMLRYTLSWKRDEVMKIVGVQHKQRHKVIDSKRTIRKYLTAPSGMITRFAYRESRSKMLQRGLPMQFLVIGDVSGSMGRYVGVALYLLSSLRSLALVDSYVFSDAVTHASPLLTAQTFREQFNELKTHAVSWEYGTRLGTALETILEQASLTKQTMVVLFTDGGFSLEPDEWGKTVVGIQDLCKRVHHLILATPNDHLYREGLACAGKLWDVQGNPQKAPDRKDPIEQKIARFGLLARYSKEVVLCQSPADVVILVRRLIQSALMS